MGTASPSPFNGPPTKISSSITGRCIPALQRLERQGLIKSKWGTSELNRRARFYELTRAGRKKLTAETGKWERMVRAIGRVLQHPNEREN